LSFHDETCAQLAVFCEGSFTVTAQAIKSLCLAQHILRKIGIGQEVKDGSKGFALDIWVGIRDILALVDDHGFCGE
jgi:hypothetical protein